MSPSRVCGRIHIPIINRAAIDTDCLSAITGSKEVDNYRVDNNACKFQALIPVVCFVLQSKVSDFVSTFQNRDEYKHTLQLLKFFSEPDQVVGRCIIVCFARVSLTS